MTTYNVMVNNRLYKTIETDSVSIWLEENQWDLPKVVKENEWSEQSIDSCDIGFADDEDDDHMIVEVTRVSTAFIDVQFVPVESVQGEFQF